MRYFTTIKTKQISVFNFVKIYNFLISNVITFQILITLPLIVIGKERRLQFQRMTQKRDAILCISPCCPSESLPQLIIIN